MKLLDFYTSVLASVGIEDVDGEGMLSAKYNDTLHPVTVGGKRLVLPTSEILRAGNWTGRVAFHPLCEKITRNESPVLKLLKDAISLRTDTIVITLVDALMHTAASPDLHKKIGGPKVAEYLKTVPTVTEKTYKVTKKILEACKDPKYRLVNYYLKHGSKGEESASRTCVVSFPIFEELVDATSPTVFGVKVDQKERKNILGLLMYIFGDDETRACYSYGSNNPEAPYFHALLTSYYKVATKLNALLEKHHKHVEGAASMVIPLEWAGDLDTFALFRGMIPSLEGNEGASIKPVEETAAKPAEVVAERAQMAFNRPAEAEPVAAKPAVEDLPWEEPSRSTRPSPADARPSAAARDRAASPMDEFRKAWQREEQPKESDSWGSPKRREQERGRGFADSYSGRSRYDERDRDRGYDRGYDRGGRGGFNVGRGGSHI